MDRFYSYYCHWFVKNSMVSGSFEENPQIKKIEKYLLYDFYKDFLKMSDEQWADITTIEKFVTYLPRFFMGDAHTTPQTYLLQVLGVDCDYFTQFVSVEDLTDFLWDNYEASVPAENKSGKNI